MSGRHMHKRRPASQYAISRRRFSQLAALAGLSLAGSRAVAAPRAGGTVLVVGAGMAGLAAAIDLRAAGFTVVVIEGRDRVGGRISTDRSLDGVPLDMGATWIHGIRGNPINALRTKYRLKVALTNYDAMLRYDADGLPLSAPREASMERGTFAADRVVVTLSLGVLKHGDVGFTPLLPEAKRAAIDRLGMGVLNKCYLKFPRVFWDPRPQLLGYVGAARGQWAEWCNMHRFTRQPVLLGFNAGSFGEQLESQSDEEVVSSAMTVLRTIYGGSVPSPTGARVTRWKSDPFSRGSYSHIPPGASGGDYDALAASVANRVFFAGEATSRQYPGTVHGAWLSGRRAAAEVARLA